MTSKYAAYVARYAALSDKDKRYFDQLRAVDVGNYGACMNEALKIAKLYDNNLLKGFDIVFALGFRAGQRQVKKVVAKGKKAVPASNTPETTKGQYVQEVIRYMEGIDDIKLLSKIYWFAREMAE